MCLTKEIKGWEIIFGLFTTKAKKDIICYKAYVYHPKKESFISEFRGNEYRLGKLPKVNMSFSNDSWAGVKLGEVYKGYHTFVNFEDAKNHIRHSSLNMVVCECIIPKGSKYIRGWMNGLKIENYVSNNLTIITPVYHNR